nr:hypothetical protein [uncultured Brevundimonas sp.]
MQRRPATRTVAMISSIALTIMTAALLLEALRGQQVWEYVAITAALLSIALWHLRRR